MKKIIGILVCTLLIATAIPAVGNVNNISISKNDNETNPTNNGEKWMKTYGGQWYDGGKMVQLTNDGCYIVAGNSWPDSSGQNDFWLIKIDTMGNKIWDKKYGLEYQGFCYSVRQTSDNGYILVGYTETDLARGNYLLIKTDEDGNKLWENTYGENGNQMFVGRDVIQTSDGGYIMIGVGDSTATWIIKTDSNGNLVWDKKIWDLETDIFGEFIKQTPDGGFIITGAKEINDDDVWLIKLDSDGNNLWDKTFGGVEYDKGLSIQITNDGGFIICGVTATREGLGFDIDVWLIKTDSEGELIWDKKIGTSDYEYGYSVQQTNDNGYIIAGVFSDKIFYTDALLIKTNSEGQEEWRKTFGGLYYDEVYSVQQTSDGGYIIAGSTESYGVVNYDIWLIKTDSDGNGPTCRSRSLWRPRLFELFPNLYKILEDFLKLIQN